MMIRKILELMLEESWPYLTLDLHADGIEVPEMFRSQKAVTLQIGYNMPQPIPDLKIDEFGVQATLGFNRGSLYYLCKMPWDSILQISSLSEHGRIFVANEHSSKINGLKPEEKKPEEKKPAFRLIKNEK